VDNGLKLSHKLILIVVIFSAVFEITFYSISRNEILEGYKSEAVSLTSLASRELRNPLYFLDLDGLEHAVQNIKQNPDNKSVYVMFSDGRIITDGTLGGIVSIIVIIVGLFISNSISKPIIRLKMQLIKYLKETLMSILEELQEMMRLQNCLPSSMS
jgi:hypothetical protein